MLLLLFIDPNVDLLVVECHVSLNQITSGIGRLIPPYHIFNFLPRRKVYVIIISVSLMIRF